MKSAKKQFKKESPGRLMLIDMMNEATLQARAMTLACLKIASLHKRFKNFLTELLEEKIDKTLKEDELDAECERLPAEKWLKFAQGFSFGCEIGGGKND